MTDNGIRPYAGMTAIEQLDLYRNLHYCEGLATERGIIANAVNDILPMFVRQQAEIERLKGWENLLKAEKHTLIKAEAITAFAERLEPLKKFRSCMGSSEHELCVTMREVDAVKKEMVGDK